MSLPGRSGPVAAIACEPPSSAGSISELPIWKSSRRVGHCFGVFLGAGRFLDMVPSLPEILAEEFLDRRAVAFADIAVPIWRAERHNAVHPVRRIGPEHAAITYSLDEVLKVPVKREARDHRVEQVVRQRSYERGGNAPRRAIEPDFGG